MKGKSTYMYSDGVLLKSKNMFRLNWKKMDLLLIEDNQDNKYMCTSIWLFHNLENGTFILELF